MFRLIPVEDVYFAVHKSYLLFPSLIFGFHLVRVVRVNVAILRSYVLVRLPETMTSVRKVMSLVVL